jgi:hypothetical protein
MEVEIVGKRAKGAESFLVVSQFPVTASYEEEVIFSH